MSLASPQGVGFALCILTTFLNTPKVSELGQTNKSYKECFQGLNLCEMCTGRSPACFLPPSVSTHTFNYVGCSQLLNYTHSGQIAPDQKGLPVQWAA